MLIYTSLKKISHTTLDLKLFSCRPPASSLSICLPEKLVVASPLSFSTKLLSQAFRAQLLSQVASFPFRSSPTPMQQ
jgi:hypothetical protein